MKGIKQENNGIFIEAVSLIKEPIKEKSDDIFASESVINEIHELLSLSVFSNVFVSVENVRLSNAYWTARSFCDPKILITEERT